MTLAAHLDAAIGRHAAAEALRGPAGALTYRELGEHAAVLAAQLRAGGVAPDEPVPVFVANAPEDVAALLAVWRVGAVAVPVHRSSMPASVDALLAATRARCTLDALRGDAVERLDRPPPPPRPMLEGAAFVIYTSGSTGTPKGVVLAHDRFGAKLEAIDSRLAFAPGERVLLVLNITFVFGLWVALLTLLRGGTLVMRGRFDAADFLATLADERIDRVAVVPTMMRALFAATSDADVAAGAARAGDAGRPRELLVGGESLGASLAARIRAALPATRLVDLYGLTETSACDFYLMPGDHPEFAGCIGRPGPGERYRIVTSDGATVAPGEIGELEIDTPFLMRGYLDAPALTAAAVRDGWLRTGDLARERAPGAVELAGRAKDLISRGGNKVSPLEIEHALAQHPDVTAALAAGVPDDVLGERIHVLLVPRPGVQLERAAVLAFAAARLERYRLPDALYVAAELPQGRTGKADRSGLRALILGRSAAAAGVTVFVQNSRQSTLASRISMHSKLLWFLLLPLALAAPVHAQRALPVVKTDDYAVRPVVLVEGLANPWSIAWLPDGRALVTERAGRLRVLSRDYKLAPQPIAGLPANIEEYGQGGLFDAVPHPRFAENGWVYIAYAGRGEGGIGTELARGRLVGNRLENVEVLFRQTPKGRTGRHFGGRIVFDRAGYLYLTLGDRGEQERAQKPDDHAGSVIRLHDDGRVPTDNPFVAQASYRPEKFTLGNRNMQGAAVHPQTGALWTHEHGPQGGDEINVIRAGTNYGWPVITYGANYGTGTKIGEGTAKPGMAQPLHYWVPSIAPSGMAFYTGDRFPQWRGNLLVGALRDEMLVRLQLDGEKVVKEERMLKGVLGRIRDVRVGPDGFVYALTDAANGVVVRLEPAN